MELHPRCFSIASSFLVLLTAPIIGLGQAPAHGFITVHPAELSQPLPNLYMGWGIWAGRHGFGNTEKSYTVEQNTTGFGDDAPLFNWVLMDWDWASLEPQEGTFNWSDFDAIVQYWSTRGKQFAIRFWVTDDAGWNGKPGADVLPQWLWAKGLRYREYKGNGGVLRREPDYADTTYEKVYLPALSRFLASFAQRYDKPDSPIILLQVMGYGHWADWATWYSRYAFPNVETKHRILARIMQAYIDVFKHIRLFEFAGPDWDASKYETLDDFMYSKALDVAVANRFALIWTGFIDGLGGTFDRVMMEQHWRQHPIIAEGNWNYDDMMDQRTHGTLNENLDVALNWHANFTHYYMLSDTYKRAMREQPGTIERGLRSSGLGYRIVPTSLSWQKELPAGQLLVLKEMWVNRNVGRLYVRHGLKLYLTDEKGNEKYSRMRWGSDQTAWIQGETYENISTFQLSKDLAPGNYDVRIALVDRNGKPRIKLAIEGADDQNRYRIGTIRVLPVDAIPGCDRGYCP